MRRLILLLLLPLQLLLGGCWDRIEINDLAIIALVGVDKVEEGVRLSVRVVVPGRSSPGGGGEAGGGKGHASVVYSATGSSIPEAAKRIQVRTSRWLFWGHARVIVFGEEMARAGIAPVLDFWTRHRQPREITQVAIAEGTALEFLSYEPSMERLLSEALRELLNIQLQSRVTVSEFVHSLRSPGHQPSAPMVTGEPGLRGGTDVLVTGTALFRGDRMVGRLNRQETEGLLWLENRMRDGTLTVELPDGGTVSVGISDAQARIEPRFVDQHLQMQVALSITAEVQEIAVPVDLDKPATVRKVEATAAALVRSRTMAALRRIQQDAKTDAAGFGNVVRRYAQRQWELDLKRRWDEVFPEVPVAVTVAVQVQQAGSHGQGLWVPGPEGE